MINGGPDVPVITLANGAHRIAIFDPRANPLALGARYILGGYIAAWQVGDRLLTGRAKVSWDAYDGCGLPDCHEWGLGFADTPIGERYLRIGAGQRVRGPRDRIGEAGGSLASAAVWTITAQGADHLTWTTSDALVRHGKTIGYRMERTIVLHADGPEVQTSLELDCRWAEPVNWFPHPFIAQQDGTGTGICLPAGARLANSTQTDGSVLVDGTWRAATKGGFAVAVGVWGQPSHIAMACDTRLGGGTVHMGVDRPIDRIVLWASQRVASAEPFWARAWQRGERSAWSVRYRFTA